MHPKFIDAEKGPNDHNFKDDYVQMAVSSGNVEVLRLLLNDKDYSIPWQGAQVRAVCLAWPQARHAHPLLPQCAVHCVSRQGHAALN